MGTARELETTILRELEASNARVVGRGTDGAGHRTISFKIGEHQRTFHYGSSSHVQGRAPKNVRANLRRLLREIPQSAPMTMVKVEETPPAPPSPPPQVASPAKPQLSRKRRKEIAKRYISLRSIDALVEETGVAKNRLHLLLMQAGGDPQRFYQADLNKARQRRPENAMPKPKPAAPKQAEPKFKLRDVPPAKRGAFADNFRRHVTIAKMVYLDKTPIPVIAKHLGVSVARIYQIARENFEYRNWKFHEPVSV